MFSLSFYYIIQIIVLICTVFCFNYFYLTSDKGTTTRTPLHDDLWMIVSTSVFIPIFIEDGLDELARWMYPKIHHPSLEDDFGHRLIVFSLIFSTYFPYWMFGLEPFYTFKLLLSGLGQTLAIMGVLHKLNTFSHEIWPKYELIVVSFLYSAFQFSLMLSLNSPNPEVIYKNTLGIKLSLFCLFVSGMYFLFSSREMYLIYSDVSRDSLTVFTTRKYICTILFILITAYFANYSLFFTYFLFVNDLKSLYTLTIIEHTVFVMATTLLPSRMIRGKLLGFEEKAHFMAEMKSFVRYVSHEVRSPLSTATLGLDCLRDMLLQMSMKSQTPKLYVLEDNNDFHESFDLIEDCKISCLAAVQTLNDLLLFDKLENNMLQLEPENVNCQTFLIDCLKPFLRQLQVSGIKLSLDITEVIDNISIYIDKHKLEQVIRNFMTNAIKFTPNNGRITIRCLYFPILREDAKLSTSSSTNLLESLIKNGPNELPSLKGFSKNSIVSKEETHNLLEKKGKIRFEVQDTGAGISKENQEKLFQQYIQFDSARLQGGKGSGLGLWLSKSIVEMHKGVVGASSPGVNKGSTFFFEIPAEVKVSSSPRSIVNWKAAIAAKFDMDDSKYRSPMKESTSMKDNNDFCLENPNKKSCKLKFDETTIPEKTSEKVTEPGSIRMNLKDINIPDIQITSPQTPSKKYFKKSPRFDLESEILPKPPANITIEEFKRSNSRSHSFNTSTSTTPISLLNPHHSFDHKSSIISVSSDPTQLHSSTDVSSTNVTLNNFKHRQSSLVILPETLSNSTVILLLKDQLDHNQTNDILSPGSTEVLKTLKVLIADDSAIARKMMERLLLPLVYSVSHSSNGNDAFDQVRHNISQFDLVLIDYHMPGMDGPETIAAMRTAGFSGLIFAITAANSTQEQDFLIDSGADVIMAKPFDIKIFKENLMVFLKGKEIAQDSTVISTSSTKDISSTQSSIDHNDLVDPIEMKETLVPEHSESSLTQDSLREATTQFFKSIQIEN